MNKFEKFTPEVKRVLIIAQDESKAQNSSIITTSHILIGILSVEHATSTVLLKKFGVSIENVRRVIKSGLIAQDAENADERSELSIFTQEVIENSARIALKLQHPLVSIEHILLAITQNELCEASIILKAMRVRPTDIRQEI